MDGGHNEKDEKERIKQTVKETNNLKRLLRNPRCSNTQCKQDGNTAADIDEEAFQNVLNQIGSPFSSTQGSSKFEEGNDNGSAEGHTTIHKPVDPGLLPPSTKPEFPQRFASRINYNLEDRFQASNDNDPLYFQRRIPVSVTLDEREANLLMHYLDHVFPLQFPLYKPSVAKAGRGWLLNVIFRTKPLFYIVLSLGACHIQTSLHLENFNDNKSGSNILEDIERHHTLAVSELRRHIDGLELFSTTGDVARKIEILACMMQLVSFEVSSSFLFLTLTLTQAKAPATTAKQTCELDI
jgi:hypothetical protein